MLVKYLHNERLDQDRELTESELMEGYGMKGEIQRRPQEKLPLS